MAARVDADREIDWVGLGCLLGSGALPLAGGVLFFVIFLVVFLGPIPWWANGYTTMVPFACGVLLGLRAWRNHTIGLVMALVNAGTGLAVASFWLVIWR